VSQIIKLIYTILTNEKIGEKDFKDSEKPIIAIIISFYDNL